MTSYREERVHKYFIPTPALPEITPLKPLAVTAVAGSAAALIGVLLLVVGGPAAIGVVLLLAGGVVGWVAITKLGRAHGTNRVNQQRYARRYDEAEPKATDKEMNQWLEESLEIITAEGLRRLDLSEHELAGETQLLKTDPDAGRERLTCAPLTLIGMPSGDRPDVFVARGTDKVLRCNRYDIAIVYLAEWKMCFFQCELDLGTGAFADDECHDFGYQFINTLSTRSNRVSTPVPRSGSSSARDGDAAPDPGPATAPDGHKVLMGPPTASTPVPEVWHRTTEQEFRIGVAGDHISVVVGVTEEESLGSSEVGFGKSTVDQNIRIIRQRLMDYGRRSRGGVGATDDPDDRR